MSRKSEAAEPAVSRETAEDLASAGRLKQIKMVAYHEYAGSNCPGTNRPGQYGYNNRLVITLPAGSTLPADYYRVYLPNNGPTAIKDVFGNQLDGEFKGYKDASGSYVDLLPNGQVLVGGRDLLITMPRQWRNTAKIELQYASPVSAPIS